MGDKPTFAETVAEIRAHEGAMVQLGPQALYHWFWENQDAITSEVAEAVDGLVTGGVDDSLRLRVKGLVKMVRAHDGLVVQRYKVQEMLEDLLK